MESTWQEDYHQMRGQSTAGRDRAIPRRAGLFRNGHGNVYFYYYFPIYFSFYVDWSIK